MALKSPATSVVFYKLISGVTTPKQLADALNKTPPAIIKQLKRLRKLGLIKLGKKEGKFQHYEVNRRKFINFVLNRAPKLGLGMMVTSHMDRDLYLKAQGLTRDLSRNERFRTLFFDYLRYIAMTKLALETEGFQVPMTLFDMIENFEESLIYLFPKIKKEKIRDEATVELISLLKTWCDITQKTVPPYVPLEKALKNLNLL